LRSRELGIKRVADADSFRRNPIPTDCNQVVRGMPSTEFDIAEHDWEEAVKVVRAVGEDGRERKKVLWCRTI